MFHCKLLTIPRRNLEYKYDVEGYTHYYASFYAEQGNKNVWRRLKESFCEGAYVKYSYENSVFIYFKYQILLLMTES